MVAAGDRRHYGRFPFFVVFAIALIIGFEFFFGTLQLQSSLRSSDTSYDEIDLMMNRTIETLLTRLPDRSEERIISLEKRLASLESALRSHNNVDADNVTNHPAHDAKASTFDQGYQQFVHFEPQKPFCVMWKENMDEWWTHHPDWYVSNENDTHYCFSPIEDRRKVQLFRKLYQTQFKLGDCSKVVSKRMWSSGWGADFENVVDGLKYALDFGDPVQFFVEKESAWHYAAKKDGSRPVCKSKDMYCYFLNLSSCPATPDKPYEGDFLSDFDLHGDIGRWLLEYATRQQTWLRRKVYRFSKKIQITTPCTVMHVRRTDIVLHEEYARKYRKIEEYVEALDNSTKNILLLTDDQNAVEEAKTLYPDYNWMYIKRPRHRGAEGGWENQIPSDNPMLEVTILLTIFRLVRKCDSLIHTYSNFAKVIKGEMKDALKGKYFRTVDLDEGDPDLFHANNSMSVNVSVPFP